MEKLGSQSSPSKSMLPEWSMSTSLIYEEGALVSYGTWNGKVKDGSRQEDRPCLATLSRMGFGPESA